MSSIVFLSHTYRESVFKVGSYHLTRELAALGHRVAHISTPISLIHLIRGVDHVKRDLVKRGPTEASDGVVDYVPLSPVPARWHWSSRDLGAAFDRVGIAQPDFIFIDQPLIAARPPDGSTVIFRPTDIKTHRVDAKRAATVMAHFADGLAATSPIVRASLPNPRRIPTTLIENGCEIARFSSYRDDAERRGFVYVGAMDSRFDLDAVIRLAQQHHTEPVHLFGPATEAISIAASTVPNLSVHGPIDYGDVPRVLQCARVGLLPFTRSSSNRGRSPMKLYEYLAAGLNVLSSEPIRADGAVADSTFAYVDDEQLREASQRALAHEPDRAAILASIAPQDWSANASRLMDFATGLQCLPR